MWVWGDLQTYSTTCQQLVAHVRFPVHKLSKNRCSFPVNGIKSSVWGGERQSFGHKGSPKINARWQWAHPYVIYAHANTCSRISVFSNTLHKTPHHSDKHTLADTFCCSHATCSHALDLCLIAHMVACGRWSGNRVFLICHSVVGWAFPLCLCRFTTQWLKMSTPSSINHSRNTSAFPVLLSWDPHISFFCFLFENRASFCLFWLL